MGQGGCYKGGVLQGYVVEKLTSGTLSGGESCPHPLPMGWDGCRTGSGRRPLPRLWTGSSCILSERRDKSFEIACFGAELSLRRRSRSAGLSVSARWPSGAELPAADRPGFPSPLAGPLALSDRRKFTSFTWSRLNSVSRLCFRKTCQQST
jgi:hypothetical protein